MGRAADAEEHERRHVAYDAVEDSDEDEEVARKQKRSFVQRHGLLTALGAVLLVVLLAFASAFLYARSEGVPMTKLFGNQDSNTSPPSSIPPQPPSTPTAAIAGSSAPSLTASARSSTSSTLSALSLEESVGSDAAAKSPSTLEGNVSQPTSRGSQAGSTSASATTSTSAPASASTTATSSKSDEYWTKTYSGVGTHFPGASSALSCGDVYASPSTTLFAALCASLYDAAPGSPGAESQNRNPVCGAFVEGRKGLDGQWVDGSEEGADWVVVGGDGELNCVGTEAVRCHIPHTITATYGSVTVSGIMIVDRNQVLELSPCGEGDVDLSDMAYLKLGETDVLSSGLKGVSWTWDR